MSDRPILYRRLQEYCDRKGLAVEKQLGFGVHGIVFEAKGKTKSSRRAIKVHEHEADYFRERDVYLRLDDHDVQQIRECAVPAMLDFDDELWVIVMTIVPRPFVLDFAGAFLDRSPGFSEEVLADWHAEKQEQFGSRWPEVQAILRDLEFLGIYMVDVHPNNISFADG